MQIQLAYSNKSQAPQKAQGGGLMLTHNGIPILPFPPPPQKPGLGREPRNKEEEEGHTRVKAWSSGRDEARGSWGRGTRATGPGCPQQLHVGVNATAIEPTNELTDGPGLGFPRRPPPQLSSPKSVEGARKGQSYSGPPTPIPQGRRGPKAASRPSPPPALGSWSRPPVRRREERRRREARTRRQALRA